jgi:cytidylate kinase
MLPIYSRRSRRRIVTEAPSHFSRKSTIAIDGPAASGKSAIGLELASRLRYRFFDTGAMYRAVTWLALQRAIDPNDEAALAHLAESVAIQVRDVDGAAAEPTGVLLDVADATPHLREPAVEASVSLVSRVPSVRAALVRIQRALASPGRVVMAGRDIGSVVLPDAGLKIFLDASREVRAQRRLDQLHRDGVDATFDEILADLTRRDGIDESRATSPLTAAPGAEIIHTDRLSIEEVVARILRLAA